MFYCILAACFLVICSAIGWVLMVCRSSWVNAGNVHPKMTYFSWWLTKFVFLRALPVILSVYILASDMGGGGIILKWFLFVHFFAKASPPPFSMGTLAQLPTAWQGKYVSAFKLLEHLSEQNSSSLLAQKKSNKNFQKAYSVVLFRVLRFVFV